MNLDALHMLESDPEYRRMLAELPPDQRLKLLGEDFDLNRQLQNKRRFRRAPAGLSPEEKLRMLEELRMRAQIQRGLRVTPRIEPAPTLRDDHEAGAASTAGATPQGPPRVPAVPSVRFGGRATASGVNYEARVAAFLAVKMLAGSQTAVWENITGGDLSGIAMQVAEPVDDIVVTLRDDPEARVFISAKERSGSVALTRRDPAFVETVGAFVGQFLKLSSSARAKSRFVWAVPNSVGPAGTQHLARVLKEHRDAAGGPLDAFLGSRRKEAKKAVQGLLDVTTQAWRERAGRDPSDGELRQFLGAVFVEVLDFGPGQRLPPHIQGDIGSHIVADSKFAPRAWEKLEHHFLQMDCQGTSADRASLRRALTDAGIPLRRPTDYSGDLAALDELTERNLLGLKDHTTLAFGDDPGDLVHIDRQQEFSALITAAKLGHLLLTGEPGCGKSGMIHALAEALRNEGVPVVLLLADEDPPNLTHRLDQILANWPDGAGGFLITDALDALRDADRQKRLRRLLRDVREGQASWKVIASVREFDLKYSRELRDTFPGAGVAGFSSSDFPAVAHFHLPRLAERQVDELVSARPEIRSFIEGARTNPNSGGVHRSPFHLRLAADLLRAGVPPAHLADWQSPALLLRTFWETRVSGGAGAGDRENALKAICQALVRSRRLAVSRKQLSLSASERASVDELRSRGILNSPGLRRQTQVGGDEIRFTHHLLHDYAIARCLIPETPDPFYDFVLQDHLLPTFYRQSFLFALEQIWDAPDERSGFWQVALRLEGAPQLRSMTRILAPLLAARRVEALADLRPLLTALGSATGIDDPAHRALRHLASGLQDVEPEIIRTGAGAWGAFARELAKCLPSDFLTEAPLVHILARLNAVGGVNDASPCRAVNAAARDLTAHHVSKGVGKGRPYAALVAIELLYRTFHVAPPESEHALLSLLAPERLVQFPHDDLSALAQHLKHLGAKGDRVIVRLFEAAFSDEPEPGQWEERGSPSLRLRFQSSDRWNTVHHLLADYYESRGGDNPALMTEAACIAWNAVMRRRLDGPNREERILATIQFRGARCDLVEDYGHIWGRGFDYDENRILSHFEALLRGWAAEGDPASVNQALDRFAARNRTSMMWTIFMVAGAQHPSTLGVLLEGVLSESLFLTHPDYAYASVLLLEALHKLDSPTRRERLERLILDLPLTARLPEGEPREPAPPWVEHAQNRLLGVLEERNIVLGTVRDLRRARGAATRLPANRPPERPQVISRTFTAEERVERRGVDLSEPRNKKLFELRESLKPFLAGGGQASSACAIDEHWPLILECDRVLEQPGQAQRQMTEDLWGHLVGACATIAQRAPWPKTDERWPTVRKVLLKASTDPVPTPSEDWGGGEDEPPGWGWPSPRIDAACGLPFLACRLGQADDAIAAALRRLCHDPSYALRFNLAGRLAVLDQSSSDLMWELVDTFIADEERPFVLDAVLSSLDCLWAKAPNQVKPRVNQIADRARKIAPTEHHIHTTLAQVNLFYFLRTGDPDCESFITGLIQECDSQRASVALKALLHSCRNGGWLTAEGGETPAAYADKARTRTWRFFSQVLAAAQIKLQQCREESRRLHAANPPPADTINPVQARLDRLARLVDDIGAQLYFASGALDERPNLKDRQALNPAQRRQFWSDSQPLLDSLATEPHPHTAHQLVETLNYLFPCAPREIFLLAAKSIRISAAAGLQYESLAVGDVVRLIQRALADHRDLFESYDGQESECLSALLEVLDLFVEVGWAEARQLTHRLEEIYR